MNTNAIFTNMDGSSLKDENITKFDVKKPPVKIEEITINEYIIEQIVSEEGKFVDHQDREEESLLLHHRHSELNYSNVTNLNLQGRKLPLHIDTKQEDCVKQGELDEASIKNEETSENDCCQKSEEQETNELTSELDIENAVFKKFGNHDISLSENKLCELKCGVLESDEMTTKAEHEQNNPELECASCEFEQAVTQHGNVEMLKCGFCEYTTKTKKRLRQHIEVEHDENCELLKCAVCEFMTRREECLKRHMTAKHDENCRTFICGFCEHTTKHRYSLIRHIKVKHDSNCETLRYRMLCMPPNKI